MFKFDKDNLAVIFIAAMFGGVLLGGLMLSTINGFEVDSKVNIEVLKEDILDLKNSLQEIKENSLDFQKETSERIQILEVMLETLESETLDGVCIFEEQNN